MRPSVISTLRAFYAKLEHAFDDRPELHPIKAVWPNALAPGSSVTIGERDNCAAKI